MMIATDTDRLFENVLSRAIAEVRNSAIDVYTFAVYHDHESTAVSVCVDTKSNSDQSVLSQNAFRMKRFARAISKGDLPRGALCRANVGRNLSLGDFAIVNMARTALGLVTPDDYFYLAMIRAVLGRMQEIVLLTSDPERLLFCTSSAQYEVDYLWTVRATMEQ